MKKGNKFVQTSGRKSKWIICIVLAMLLVLCVVLAFTLPKKEEPLTASAAEGDIDNDLYPGANYLTYPFNTTISYSWSTIISSESVLIYSYSNFNADPGSRRYAKVSDCLLMPGTYTLSGGVYISANNYAYVGLVDSNGDLIESATSSFTFTLSARKSFSLYLIAPSMGSNLDGIVVKPMLNKGSIALPFTPNLQSVYDYANNAGQETGYQQGLNDGTQEAEKGVFNGTTFDIKYTYDGTNYLTKTNLTPNFANGGIYFHDIWNEIYQNSAGEILYDCTLMIHPKPFIYNTNIQNFFGLGFGLNTPIFKTQDNKRYYTEIANDNYLGNGYLYVIKESNVIANVLNYPVIEIEMYLGRASDTLNEWYLCSTGGSFNAGFTNGYNKGQEDGKIEGYDKGKTEGLIEGKEQGFREGYEKGAESAGSYTFLSLMSSVVDAPVKAFTGLLDFDILGFNMASVVISLLSVALLLKLISLFSKGK